MRINTNRKSSEPSHHRSAASFLHRAALLALRGHGYVEPNPMVGCIITDPRGEVVGMGHHERYGGPHAEVHALCAAGDRARGGIMFVTLEPCAHHGKTPPCTDAIIRAGIARVVIAQPDPTPFGGGAKRLRDAGIEVSFNDSSALANDVSAPFRHRAQTGLPWVIAKWAQTLDGRIVTRPDEPRWISNATSRRMVHRERGRVDAILTGIGTVLADDPLLLPSNVPVRRLPQRLILDTHARMSVDSRIVASACEAPVRLIHAGSIDRKELSRLVELRNRHVTLQEVLCRHDVVDVENVLRTIAAENCTTAMIEAGPRVLSSLLQQNFVNQAWVFVADGANRMEEARHSVESLIAGTFASPASLLLQNSRVRRSDLILLYRVG